MNKILNRIYGDYLMPSRLQLYDALLAQARDAGYRQTSVRAFHRSLRDGGGGAGRTIVHRHDIDSDTRTARKMFDIEIKHGIHSSYYFRISTLNFPLMRDIEEYGSEASYHYEEIASYAKKHHIKDPGEIRRRLPEIRSSFLDNFNHIEGKLGRKIETVASHGDFANRRLNIINNELLDDPLFRARCGIECETYDPELLSNFDVYISDRPYPRHYHPISPFSALVKYKRICFLTHPVQWETNWMENTKCNAVRLYEELRW